MEELNKVLSQLGITKVKLAKILGVSRQMVYNYFELGDLDKWPKDKRVLIFNLLGIKSPEEIKDIKVDIDYIEEVEENIERIFDEKYRIDNIITDKKLFSKIENNQKEILADIIEFMKETLENNKDQETYITFLYLYHFLKTMQFSPELKYFLAYISKAAGFTKPDEFTYNEGEQFTFESIMFSAMTLYNNSGGTSKSKLAESRRRFVQQIEQKMEEKMSRTLELNSIKMQALKELGYNEITADNGSMVFERMAEIEARKVSVKT